ncbi:peptidase M50 [Parageobacillus thermoglucosidasius]|uniref:site-2 protease family protein n=1 Tax=Parageobacillus thermoglucosidasius TaxID=1426 RepID=UPI000E12D1B9|nr:site-2 protease family protein [Parageobacillus thermoglucosidasius]RDE33658.1 peptidase M50 [Parageobacillus thermoglucosidasius]
MKRLKKAWIAFLSVILFLSGKLKWVLAVFKFLKFSSLISLFISIGAYAMVYGWKFAVALVYLLYVHEMGHLFAAKRLGIPTSKAIFIPFVGALIALKEKPKSAKDEAYLAYAGPLWGTLGFLPALPLFWMTGDPFWGLVIALGALINLFNLMPLHPLDGGRIAGVISPKLWFVGLMGMTAYFLWKPGPIAPLIILLGAVKCWELLRREFRWKKAQIHKEVNESLLREIQRYMLLSEEEQQEMYWRWEDDLERAEAELQRRKTWHIPVFQDEQKLQNYRLERYVEKHHQLLEATRWGALQEQTVPDFIRVLQKEIEENEQAIQKQTVYYRVEAKTKWAWLCLYLALAVVLAVFTAYGQQIMDANQPLIS